MALSSFKRVAEPRSLKSYNTFLMVRSKGIEPPRFYSPEPKSGASTNSATSAFIQSRTSWSE